MKKMTCCLDSEDVVDNDRRRRRWSELVVAVILPGPDCQIERLPKSHRMATMVVAHGGDDGAPKPIKQKKQMFNVEVYVAMAEEVYKLLKMIVTHSPNIDQLVDSIVGHELLSFMDVLSGYHQLHLKEED
ncbi:hypothetical protein ACLOJK_037246 [Asimina triloba]